MLSILQHVTLRLCLLNLIHVPMGDVVEFLKTWSHTYFTDFTDEVHKHFLPNSSQVNATEHLWWSLNTLKPETRLFVENRVYTNKDYSINHPQLMALCEGNPLGTSDSPHQRRVVWKEFLCHDLFMQQKGPVSLMVQLLCHVQNFVAITFVRNETRAKGISIKFELWWKNH